jgi:glycogen(starch) synthase
MYGGLARHAENLTRAQHAAGLDVGVLTVAEDVTAPERRLPAGDAVRRGVRVRRVRRAGPRAPWTDLLAAAEQLESALAEQGSDLAGAADVIHAHDWIGARAAARLAASTGIPMVLTVHATEWGRHAGRVDAPGLAASVHALERQGVAAADAVVTCSEAMRVEAVQALGADPGRLHVVPNAVDARTWHCPTDFARQARRHWLRSVAASRTEPDGGPLFVAAGRLEWEKGFSTLIRAMPTLRERLPGLRVVLAGRGSYAGRLRELAGEVGVLDIVTMPGWLSARDLAALYAASDAVVVPSRYEPSGLVAREAQAAGAVVVATPVGGLADAVAAGRTGLTFDVGDVHGLADALTGLARDPARTRALAGAGQAAAQALSWDVAAKAVEAIYAELLG